jgi:hypothetical protein
MITSVAHVRALIREGQSLAGALVRNLPDHPMYQAILRDLSELGSFRLPEQAAEANAVAAGLGRMVARELDNASGLTANLASVIHKVSGELYRMAGSRG